MLNHIELPRVVIINVLKCFMRTYSIRKYIFVSLYLDDFMQTYSNTIYICFFSLDINKLMYLKSLSCCRFPFSITYRFFTFTCQPSFGKLVTYLGSSVSDFPSPEGCRWKFFTIFTKANLASSRANLIPMQFLGP